MTSDVLDLDSNHAKIGVAVDRRWPWSISTTKLLQQYFVSVLSTKCYLSTAVMVCFSADGRDCFFSERCGDEVSGRLSIVEPRATTLKWGFDGGFKTKTIGYSY